MRALENSFVYHIYRYLAGFFAGQWENSAVIRWFTGQKTRTSGGWGDRLHGALTGAFRALKLDRLLEGSIFLRPELFAAAAVLLSPLVPTMVVLALVCGSFFAMFLRLGVDETARLSPGPLGAYVALYALVYLYATFTSVARNESLFPGLLTVLFVLFFWVLTACRFDDVWLKRLVALMMLVGVGISFYGFYQLTHPALFRSVWTDEDMFSEIVFRVYSTLENPNVLGEYFLLVIPLGVALLFTARRWAGRLAALGACGIMGVCLIVTYSRGCYLGLLFAAAVFLVLLDRRFLVLGVILVALSPLYLPESVLSRFTSIGNMGDSSTSYRVYIWLGTLAMLKDYWFCGVGPGTGAYNVVYPDYAYNAITAPHSHNLYLQIMCDTGICGMLVLVVLLVGFYRMMFTAMAQETDRTAKIFQMAGTAAISGFLVQSMTDYTFYNYRVMMLFWAVLGLCVLFCRMGSREDAA